MHSSSLRQRLVRRRVCAIALLGAAFLVGCSERNDWDVTRSADTQEAYLAFAAKHPDSPFAAQAKQLADERREQRDWRLARTTDNAAAYRAFLGAHPSGRWSDEARARLDNLAKAAAPAATSAAPDASAAAAVDAAPVDLTAASETRAEDDPLPPPPPDPEATTPPGAAPRAPAAATAPVRDEFAGKTVTHRIQLGAFSSRDKALAGWQAARDQHIELQGLVPQVVEFKNGAQTMYRLQASVLSEQRAREACKVLVGAGQPCLYVLPGR